MDVINHDFFVVSGKSLKGEVDSCWRKAMLLQTRLHYDTKIRKFISALK